MTDFLKYIPFKTSVDTAFWHQVAEKKLHEFKLEEGPFDFHADFCNNSAQGLSPSMFVDVSSLNDKIQTTRPPSSIRVAGELHVFNTMEKFKTLDRQSFINDFGLRVIQKAVENSTHIENPNSLNKLLLTVFADIKRHKFHFWFAHPSVLFDENPTVVHCKKLNSIIDEAAVAHLLHSYDAWRSSDSSAFFTLVHDPSSPNYIHVMPFSSFDVSNNLHYLGFCDPSTHPEHPGWVLRNMLYALSTGLKKLNSELNVLCFRDRIMGGQRTCNHSLIIRVQIKQCKHSSVNFVGWEATKSKLRPNLIDLSSTMDSLKLAETAVDLNLQLMKWRVLPGLKLDIIKEKRCLVLGAGTLGCNVSRQLVGWGIRHITFVDNARVSFSNPVRQSLFTFADAENQGKPKAFAAADSLKKIFPSIKAEGHILEIPMPGHPIMCPPGTSNTFTDLKWTDGIESFASSSNGVEKVYHNCCLLDQLIKQHDVIFLLMDTRESRWLPTLLSKVHGKLVINAALGFSSYLVMRHGSSFSDTIDSDSTLQKKTVPGSLLGCYFCNDVIGPSNSTTNRTLDQQCTVTRPGVSMIAAALAVEMMISLIQNADGGDAKAPIDADLNFTNDGDAFDIVPHQIRGFLSSYSQIVPTTTSFPHCTACSQPIADAFQSHGFGFLLRVFNDAAYLEQVSGLSEMRDKCNFDDITVLSDDDSC